MRGANLRIVMSSIMRWRKGLTGVPVMGMLLSWVRLRKPHNPQTGALVRPATSLPQANVEAIYRAV